MGTASGGDTVSVKIMGLVWDADLARDEKYILLAYADHADHAGNNVYPSVGLISYKTQYSTRSVQRVSQKLEGMGILVATGKGPNGTRRWRIDVEKLPARAPWGSKTRGVTNWQGDTSGARGVTNATEETPPVAHGGDIAMSPEPSLTVMNHHGTIIYPEHKNVQGVHKELTESQLNFSALAKVCAIDVRVITKKQRGILNQTERTLREGVGITADDLVQYGEWWYNEDWRGKKGQPPTPAQVRDNWGKFAAWRDGEHTRSMRIG